MSAKPVSGSAIQIIAYEPKYREEVLSLCRLLSAYFDQNAQSRDIPNSLDHDVNFLAINGSQVIGFVSIAEHDREVEVKWIGVHPELWRGGIGSQLLERAIAHAQRKGMKEVMTRTLDDSVDYPPYELTRNFYKKNGFIKDRVEPLYWNKENPCLVLVKRLEQKTG